ncbi:hypothetical protein C6369_001860 [Rhodococcus rhodochrous]|uniref:YdeI/OmpD-associated family protein n=1 Tax=Rhodococcus rhodochrous TaxID=1829 RepID=UPI000D0587DD|nr:YdeI/OmpD-associated family protein [Rhodococcus rhodochrous]AYA23412.1 hypothetical protein C6369_001860 [Rhodococcus rhodochrous]
MTRPHEITDPLCVADAAHWRAWLDTHEDGSDGVWLVLARKSVTAPTSLTYQEALEEALCSGWIDGQRRGRDDQTFLQRFTPRRARSMWSQRNVGLVSTLVAVGRMRPRGEAEIARARADGRWDRAYAGPAAAEPPPDLLAALAAEPGTGAAFEQLSRTERYQVLHPILTAADDAVRAARIARAVARLAPR